MEFPQWAPKTVCIYYRCFSATWVDTEKELGEQLLTNPEMAEVWKALEDVDRERRSADLFFDNICVAHYGAQKKHLTRRELIQKYEDIAKRTKELARLLKEREFTLQYQTYCDTYKLRHILDHLPKKNTSNVEECIKMLKAALCEPSLSYYGILEALQGETKECIKFLRGKLKKDGLHYRKAAALSLLSDDVEEPNAEPANYFIRDMADHFQDIFGSPRYSLLAKLARVAMDNPDIDEDYVRKSLKQYKKS